MRTVALAVVVGLGLVFGARSADPSTADPVRVALLQAEAADLAAVVADGLATVESLLRAATEEARAGQAAILAGSADPAALLSAAADAFEDVAAPLDRARADLDRLAWILHALDPDRGFPPPDLPPLEITAADAVTIASQWRDSAIPAAALADLRRGTGSTLEALAAALAALQADDLPAAIDAAAEAERSLDAVRATRGVVDDPTFDYWLTTAEAMTGATRAIAEAATAGDAVALAEAQAEYRAASEEAMRADQALAIVLGEAATSLTRGASASTAEALRSVVAARDAVAGLSILR